MQSKIKLTPNLLRELGKDIFLEVNQEEIKEILAIEENILDRFEKVLAIDTEGVEPLFYPFEEPRNYLRNDEESKVINHQSVLGNAKNTIGPYVVITRVVK